MSYYDTSTDFGNFLASGNRDAAAYVDSLLGDLGLNGLSQWSQDLVTQFGADLSNDEFLQRLRQTDTYKTSVYGQVAAIAKKNGTAAPTEAEILATTKQYQQVYQQAGMPSGFYDSPTDFANLIGNNVSPAEIQTRILDGYAAVQSNPGVRDQLQTLYSAGATDGDLAAFFIDPEAATTVIQRRQAAATLANRSAQSGFGQLNLGQAEGLAGQGVTDAQAQQGFKDLSQQKGLFTGLEGENGNISNQTGLDATFNNNADAADQLKRRRAGRAAQFSGGGGFAADNKGNTGIGSAN